LVIPAPLSCDALFAEVTRLLAPVLGESMARASTRAHAEKLKINGNPVSPEQVEALLGKLGSGLVVFVGREKAKALAEELRTAVAQLGRAS
jgi:reverse gyrase